MPAEAFKLWLPRPIIQAELARSASTLPVPSARSPAAHGLGTRTTRYGVVEPYAIDPAYVVAVTGRYVIQIINQHATTTTVSVLRRAFEDLTTRYEKFGYAAIIEPDATLILSPAVREGFNSLIRRYSPSLSAAAIVYEKQGFHATALRSLVTAVNVVSRAKHANRVFSDLREGMSWLSSLTAAEPTPTGLTHIVQMLREASQNGP